MRTQPVSSGKGKPRAALLAQPALRPRATRWATKRAQCASLDPDTHRLRETGPGFSSRRGLLGTSSIADGVARLWPCALRKEIYSHLGRRDERIEEMPFSRPAEK